MVDDSLDSPSDAEDPDPDFEELLDDLRSVLEDLSAEVDVDRDEVDAGDGLVEVVTMVVGVPSRADLSVLFGAAADLTDRIADRVDDPDPPLSGVVASMTVVLLGVLRELRATLDEDATADNELLSRLDDLTDDIEAQVDGADLPSSPAEAFERVKGALGSDTDGFAEGDDVTHIEIEE